MTATTTYYLAIHDDDTYSVKLFNNKTRRDEYMEKYDCFYPYVEEDELSITIPSEQSEIDLKIIFGPDGFWGVEMGNKQEDELNNRYPPDDGIDIYIKIMLLSKK